MHKSEAEDGGQIGDSLEGSLVEIAWSKHPPDHEVASVQRCRHHRCQELLHSDIIIMFKYIPSEPN